MMGPDDRLGRIEEAVSSVLVSHGLSLVDLEFRREGRRWVLRVYVDKPGGVGIVDCQRVSGELGDLLDVINLIEDSYDLEVSSPGLHRELRKDRELRWAVGKRVRCWVRGVVGGRTEFLGALVAVSDEELRLTAADGQQHAVPRWLVTKIRLEPELPGRR
jgi:ribosome maturation factor RimP